MLALKAAAPFGGVGRFGRFQGASRSALVTLASNAETGAGRTRGADDRGQTRSVSKPALLSS
jgi:hypothetical protein